MGSLYLLSFRGAKAIAGAGMLRGARMARWQQRRSRSSAAREPQDVQPWHTISQLGAIAHPH